MIKNLIFDVGNVLLEYRWNQMLMDYGLTEEECKVAGPRIFDNEIWYHLDLGVPIKEVIEVYRVTLPEYAEVIEWFLTHADLMPIRRLDVWEKVRLLKEKGYQIYILSNYSREMIDIHTKGAEIWDYANGSVVSADCGLLKPNKEIYELLLSKYNLKAEECVFFDDKEENTAAAEKIGIKSYTITSKEYLLEILDEFLA